MTYLTVTQYVTKYGTTRQNVLAKIKRGTLKAHREPYTGIWLIEDTSD